MGSKLLTETERGGSEDTESPLFISKMFEECFPYYMSIGMTYDEYWNGDPSLVRAYRKAEDIRQHMKNQDMWLQGRYIYDAIIRLIPSFNPLKPKDPIEYMDEPYPISEKDVRERELREQKRKQEAIRNKMMAFAAAYNNKKNEEQGNE